MSLVTRRQFIKVGLAGAMLFAAARMLERPSAAASPRYRSLDEQSAATVEAFVPVILAGSLPEEPEARARAVREVVEAFDRAVSGLALTTQEEIIQLFSFLHFGPTRVAFAGLWAPVVDSSRDELGAFLLRWRVSRFDLQRASYQALTQLIQAAWYGNSSSWAAIGYPGPPQLP